MVQSCFILMAFSSRVFLFITLISFAAAMFSACGPGSETKQNAAPTAEVPPAPPVPTATPPPTPAVPNLQSEFLNSPDKTTSAPIGQFDFKNYTYELPRGWQNPDGTTDITLTNGKIAPVEGKVSESMSDEEKAEAKSHRRIGLSYVTTKFLDVTGDGEDEALVILKIETAGSAVPQLVYVFTWRGGKPEVIWPFRTGDRADGGLNDLRAENGELVIELYGQDRFIMG